MTPSPRQASTKPSLEPLAVFGFNLAIQPAFFFTANWARLCYIAGRLLVSRSIEDNSCTTMQLEPYLSNIQKVFISQTRRFLAIVSLSGNQPRIHIFSLKHMTRVMLLTFPEAVLQYSNGEVLSVSFSAHDRLVSAQLGEPDYVLAVWALPQAVQEDLAKTHTHTNSKLYSSIQVSHEVVSTCFSEHIEELIMIMSPSSVQFSTVQEDFIKSQSLFTMKRIVGAFASIRCLQDPYTLLHVPETGELIILRKDHLCCFVPEQLLLDSIRIDPGANHAGDDRFGKIVQYAIRNHLDTLSGDPGLRERITCVALIDHDIVLIGSSFGRVLVILLHDLEPKVAPVSTLDIGRVDNASEKSYALQMSCQTAGGLRVRVPELQVLRSILLPCSFRAVMHIDVCPCTQRVLVYTDGGNVFVSNSLTRYALMTVLNAQKKLLLESASLSLPQAVDGTNAEATLLPDARRRPPRPTKGISDTASDSRRLGRLSGPDSLGKGEDDETAEQQTSNDTQRSEIGKVESKPILNRRNEQTGKSNLSLADIVERSTMSTQSKALTLKLNTLNSRNTEALALAYDSVRRLRYILRNPDSIVRNSNVISLFTPMSSLPTLLVSKNADTRCTPLELELYSEPKTWPLSIIEASVFCPFTALFQTPSSIVTLLSSQGFINNGVSIDSTAQGTGFRIGPDVQFPCVPITCMEAADELGYCALGNDNGQLYVLDVVRGLPVATWQWNILDTEEDSKVGEESTSKISLAGHPSMNTMTEDSSSLGIERSGQLSSGTFQKVSSTFSFGQPLSTSLQTTQTERLGLTALETHSGPPKSPPRVLSRAQQYTTELITETIETVRVPTNVRIAAIAFHPSGRFITVAAHNKNYPTNSSPRTASPTRRARTEKGYCVCILALTDASLECKAIVDCDSPVVALTFGTHGNYFYILTHRSVYVFSFMEFRLLKRIPLGQRSNFAPTPHEFPSYSPEVHQQYQKAKQHIDDDALPTCIAVSHNLLVAVAFSDGDICLFRTHTGALVNRYITGGFFLDGSKPKPKATGPERSVPPTPSAAHDLEHLPVTSFRSGSNARSLIPKLGFHLIQMEFVPPDSFLPSAFEAVKASQSDKIPYLPLIGVTSVGTLVEFGFTRQDWSVGWIGRSSDGPPGMTRDLKFVRSLVPRPTPTLDTVIQNGTGMSTISAIALTNPGKDPLLQEYDTSRFNFTMAGSLPVRDAQIDDTLTISNIRSPMRGSSPEPKQTIGDTHLKVGLTMVSTVAGTEVGNTQAGVNGSLSLLRQSYQAPKGSLSTFLPNQSIGSPAFELPVTGLYTLPGLQYNIAINASCFATVEYLCSRAVNSARLSYGRDAYRSWNVISLSTLGPAARNATRSSFLRADSSITSLFTNTNFIKKNKQLIVTGSLLGNVVLQPYPTIDPQTHEYYQPYCDLPLHSAPVTHVAIVQGSYIVSASVDGMILISRLRFPGVPFCVKPSPSAGLDAACVIRSSAQQTVLDTLYYEVLMHMLLLRQASISYVHETTRICEGQLQGLLSRYLETQRDSLHALSAAFNRHDKALEQRKTILRDRDIQQNVILKELCDSFDEQVRVLKKQKNDLVEKLLRAEEAHGKELSRQEKELEEALKSAKKQTQQQRDDLQAQLDGLFEDEKILRQKTIDIVDKANLSFEDEIAKIKEEYTVNVMKEAQVVAQLRKKHKELDAQFALTARTTADRKNELMSIRAEAEQLLNTLQLAKNTLETLQSDIRDKEQLIRAKEKSYDAMAKEKKDLEKVGQILQGRADELNECIEPRDTVIAALAKQSRDMSEELTRVGEQQYQTNLRIANMKLTRQGLLKEFHSKQAELEDEEQHLKTLLSDMRHIVEQIAINERHDRELKRITTGKAISKPLLQAASKLDRSQSGRPRKVYDTVSYNMAVAVAQNALFTDPSTRQGTQSISKDTDSLEELARQRRETQLKGIEYACLLEKEKKIHTYSVRGTNDAIRSLYNKYCSDTAHRANLNLDDVELMRTPMTSLICGASNSTAVGTLLSTQNRMMSDEVLARQRVHLEKSVATLQKSLERRRMQLNQAIENSRVHSSELLALTNIMRRENKHIQQQLRAAKLELIKKRQSGALDVTNDIVFNRSVSKILTQIEEEIQKYNGHIESDMGRTLDPTETSTQEARAPDLYTLLKEKTELSDYLDSRYPGNPTISSPERQAKTAPKLSLPTLVRPSDGTAVSTPAQSPPRGRVGGQGHEQSEISSVGVDLVRPKEVPSMLPSISHRR
ncbi:hypothetical protein GMRT_15182 [Giardia muris]|uniref:Uncharacterized protein n=1 Tax=Giardia muris TaxID=5742 RepID=A0A4Z1T6F4_GIAMU|nr:hypothetical protein GMRT_15182 [Giardia muris]|eukprot:TNJ28119.1 hypothetical protein GMRT_15182 [Giardia muris]